MGLGSEIASEVAPVLFGMLVDAIGQAIKDGEAEKIKRVAEILGDKGLKSKVLLYAREMKFKASVKGRK